MIAIQKPRVVVRRGRGEIKPRTTEDGLIVRGIKRLDDFARGSSVRSCLALERLENKCKSVKRSNEEVDRAHRTKLECGKMNAMENVKNRNENSA